MSTEPDNVHRTIAERVIDRRSSVGQVSVSPDGSRVAYVVATTDLAANTTRTRIWLDDAPLTAGDHDANPAWSPDGRYLAFTSRRGETKGDSTVHVLPVGLPGEVRTVCTMPEGVRDLVWSPDRRWLAFVSRVPERADDGKDASWQPPRKIERFFSRLNGEGWIHDRPAHVHVVAADGTGAARDLTPGPFAHTGISWLPDSTGLVTAAQRHDTWDRDRASDLYLVTLDGPDGRGQGAGAIRALTATDGSYSSPSVSPDGSRVALVGYTDTSIYPQNARVGVITIAAEPTPAADIDWRSIDVDRTFAVGSQTPIWESEQSLLALAEDRGDTHLFRLSASGEPATVAVTSGPLTVSAASAAAGTIATARATAPRPAELFVGGERHTSLSERFASGALGWEKFAVPTSDGTGEIDAWIMRPADFDSTRTYPVLLNVHGGPHSQYGETFFDEFQAQARAGFVVVAGNPRGSSGREEAWGQAIMGPSHPVRPGPGWASVDVDDVLAVIDTALDRYPFCDRGRVGMLGGSYGGYMATWLAGHHGERFRAICSERAVNNLTSLEWSSDIATAFASQHGGTHLDLPELYAQRSPIAAVREIDVPMLIIHSEEDWRCPIGQAEELWVALRLLGKQVDFYRFPGENHELSRSGSPRHRVQRLELILDWFSTQLS